MKRLPFILTLGALSLSLPVAAAPAQAVDARLSTDGARTRFGLLESMEGRLSAPLPGLSATAAAWKFLSAHQVMLPGAPREVLELREVDASLPGITHVIMDQRFRGIPVYDSHLVVSLRSSSNEVFRAWAQLFPVPKGFRTTPTLSALEAEDRAIEAFGRPGAWTEEETELVIAPGIAAEGSFHLAWRVHLFEDESAIAKNQVLLIDAHTGAVLTTEERICTGTRAVGQGVGVWGDVKTLQTLSQDGTYYLADSSRAMYNQTANTGWIKTYKQPYSSSAAYSSDVDNSWDGTNGTASEVDAHYNAGVVYEYYRTVHGRNSFDNKGTDIKSYTHSSNQNNAFWSGSYMEYGDGDGKNFYPFAGDLGVAAHEMTHAVTQYGAALKYQYQSGALNEAFSDIMAKLEVDDDNWLIGDLVATQYFMDTYDVWALRDMQDPTFGGLYDPADPMSTYAQPDHHSIYAYLGSLQDSGGVHVNSGIINKMAQLLADGGTHYGVTVPSIGRANTAKLFYKVNSASYLATTSDFDHFTTQIQRVASDLFGSSSTQLTAVKASLQAIGLLSVGCVTDTETESNGGTSSADPISTSCTDMTGTMGSTSDKDYFKVNLPAGRTLEAFLRVPYPSDFDLYLYQGSTLVTKSVHTGIGQDESFKVTNTGTKTATVYVMVKRYSGSTGSSYKYTLNVKW